MSEGKDAGIDVDVEMRGVDEVETAAKAPTAYVSTAAMANTIEETGPEGEWNVFKLELNFSDLFIMF
jgi:hypothetical protein